MGVVFDIFWIVRELVLRWCEYCFWNNSIFNIVSVIVCLINKILIYRVIVWFVWNLLIVWVIGKNVLCKVSKVSVG